jgi:hypothetical protein
VFVGLTIHDHAYVEPDGTFTSPPTPTGNVVFTLFDKIDCTGNTASESKGLGVDPAAAGTAISSNETPLGDTKLSYKASYSGDKNYLAATDAACEPLTVNKYESKISTAIHEGTGHGDDIQNTSVKVGLTVHDHALVEEKTGGPTSPPIPKGNVTFKIFEGTSCGPPALGSYGGIDWDQTGTLGVPFDGEAVTAIFTPPGNTSFSISASWAGDANYRAATDDVCEPLTVNLWPPRILTKVIVRDLAEVAGDMPSTPPTGTVKFETYRSNDCGVASGDEPVDTDTRPLSSGVAEQLAASEQLLTVSADVASYRAIYSGDDYYEDVVHDCELVQFSVLTP